MARDEKTLKVLAGGTRSADDKRVIRRQLGWIAGLAGLGLLGWLIWSWGQDSGWGNADRAVKAKLDRGDKAFIANDLRKAAAQYQSVVDRYPTHVQATQALTQLGAALQSLGQLDEAQKAYGKLMDMLQGKPEKADLRAYTLLQMAKLEKDRNAPDSALELFERVRKEHPKTDWSGEALTGIAQVHQGKKDYPQARKVFQQVIIEMPGGFLAAEAQASIGACLEAEEKIAEAVRAYQVVLDKYPSAVWDQAKSRIDILKKQLEDKKKSKKSKPS